MNIDSSLRKHRLLGLLAAFGAAAVLTVYVYSPGISDDLYLDSTKLYQLERLYEEKGGDIGAGDLGFGGRFGRIIPQLSFYANVAADGRLVPSSIKKTNVALHFVNGMLVFALVALLLGHTAYRDRRLWFATFVAIAWLVSGINTASVLYAIQRMNQLATFFSLLALIFYVCVRGPYASRLGTAARGSALMLGVGVLAVSAYLSKETAVLLPVFIVLIELYFFPDLPGRLASRQVRMAAGVAAVAGLVLLGGLLRDSSLLDYGSRSFTLGERLLTEGRILWVYLSQLVVPTSTATGLYQDGFPVSTGLLSPPTTALSLLGIAALVAFAVRFRDDAALKPAAFGIAFFLCGHLLESTVFPLELYFEHRNYLPSVGLYAALVVVLYALLSRIDRNVAVGIALLYMAFFTFMAHAKSITWFYKDFAYQAALGRSYTSPRAASAMAQLRLQRGDAESADELLDAVIAEHPHQALRARLQKLYIDCATDRPPDAALYRELPAVTGRELAIEVSQALSNVVELHAKSGCAAVATGELIPILSGISGKLKADGRASWHVDYYVGRLYLAQDKAMGVSWLEDRFREGEESAGWYLLDLIERGEDVTIPAGTMTALNELKARAGE